MSEITESSAADFNDPGVRYYAVGFSASPEIMAEDNHETLIRETVEKLVRRLFLTYQKGDGRVKFRIEMTCLDRSHDHDRRTETEAVPV